MTGREEQIIAFQKRQVEAWMASFTYVRPDRKSNNDWHGQVLPRLSGWEQLRYLDSGTFTFLRRGQVSRLGMGSRREAEIEANKRRGSVVTVAEVRDHFAAYHRYLHEHADSWDFILDCDVDGINLLRSDGVTVPGAQVTEGLREMLWRDFGDKLIPVWHQNNPPPAEKPDVRWRRLVADFPYLGIGSDVSPTESKIRDRIFEAHEAGKIVHGLGTSKVDILSLMPYDTVDSSTWLSAARFGQFAGKGYWKQDRKSFIGGNELSRATKFEDYVRSLGEDPADLRADHETPAKYIVSIALFQERQNAASSVPGDILPSGRLSLEEVSSRDESF